MNLLGSVGHGVGLVEDAELVLGVLEGDLLLGEALDLPSLVRRVQLQHRLRDPITEELSGNVYLRSFHGVVWMMVTPGETETDSSTE